jgi:hypothetical protein
VQLSSYDGIDSDVTASYFFKNYIYILIILLFRAYMFSPVRCRGDLSISASCWPGFFLVIIYDLCTGLHSMVNKGVNGEDKDPQEADAKSSLGPWSG